MYMYDTVYHVSGLINNKTITIFFFIKINGILKAQFVHFKTWN